MEEKKLDYWQKRCNDQLQRTARDIRPSLDNLHEFLNHVDPKFKKEITEKVNALRTGVADLIILTNHIFDESRKPKTVIRKKKKDE